MSEAIAIAIGVNAAAIVDLTDIAADNMNLHLFPGPEKPEKREKPAKK